MHIMFNEACKPEESLSASTTLCDFLEASRERVDAALDSALPPESEPPSRLHGSMRYAVFSGGKRLRPALAFGAAVASGVEPERATPVACAVELIHTCSLVLDDLPALDDNAERRGQPAVHVAFDHATAILTASALLAEAFAQCARVSDPASAVTIGSGLAQAIGSRSLIGGEVDDLTFDSSADRLEDIMSIHLRKTAPLFSFALWSGGVVGDLDTVHLDRLRAIGRIYGLAFQLIDDLHDVDLDECSILHVLTPEQVRTRVRKLSMEASRMIESFGPDGWALAGLADYLDKLCADIP